MNWDSVKRMSYSLSTLNIYTSLMYSFPFRSSWKACTSPVKDTETGRGRVSDQMWYSTYKLLDIEISFGRAYIPSSCVSEESLSSVGRSSLSLKSREGEGTGTGAEPLVSDSLLSGNDRGRRSSGTQPLKSSTGGMSNYTDRNIVCEYFSWKKL